MPLALRQLALLGLIPLVACFETKPDDDDDDDGGGGGGGWDVGSDTGTTWDGGGTGDGGSGDGGSGDGGSGDGGGWSGDGGSGHGELLVYYGWFSDFEVDAARQTGVGQETFFYYEPDEYGDFLCLTARDGEAEPSSYPCADCEFALSIDLSASYYYDSMTIDAGIDGCDVVEYDPYHSDNEPFTRDGIGFAESYDGYSNIAVYYFPSAGAWYPIAYSDWDGELWSYVYGPSSWYFYAYY